MKKLQLVSSSQDSNDKSKTSQSLQNLIRKHASVAYAELAFDGKLLDASEAYSTFTGHSPDKLTTLPFNSFLYSKDRPMVLSKIQELKTNSAQECEFECRFYHKEGHIVWGMMNVTLANFETGNTSLFLQIIDISKYKQEQSRLVAAEQEMARFSERVTSDLRNPLSSVAQVNSIIERELDNNDLGAAKHFALLSSRTIAKLSSLVEGVISITQVRGAQHVASAPIDPTAIIRECVEKLKSSLNTLDIEMIILHQHIHHFCGQYQTLMKAIDSLLTNAVKYKDDSKANSFIKILTYEENDCLCISITDNGLGIPSRYHTSIFDMFTRFHPSVSDGAGLGLFLVKKCSEQLKGQVSFAPLDEETGCVFTLRIPRLHG